MTTTESSTSTTLATASESTGNADSTSTTTGGCVPGFEVAAFTQISDLAIGTTELYDMDRDGRLDVVGGRGAIVLADLDVRTLAGWPAPNDGHPGMFDGDDVPDMAYGLGPEEGMLVHRDALSDAEPPVPSPTPPIWTFARSDVDGDGIDDVAFQGETQVEVWRGNADGTQVPLATVGDNDSTLPRFARFSGTQYLAVTDPFLSAFDVFRFADGGFASAGSFAARNAHVVETVEAFGDGDEYLLVADWWSDDFLGPSSVVALAHPDSDRWTALTHDLEGAEPWDAAATDIDGDGIVEIAVLATWADLRVDLICWDGAALVRCGRVEAPIPGDSIELMPEGPRLLAAGDTGVWIADLTPTACR